MGQGENRMINPFFAPGRTSDRPMPLNPWRQTEHSEYYVAVDHTAQAFNEFEQALSGWDITYQGEAVLVHGGDGCGKTSLAHRCAKHMKDKLDQAGCKAKIVDRSAVLLDGQPVLSKCEDAVRAVLRSLGSPDGFLAPDAVNDLPKPSSIEAEENQLRRAMEEVAESLSRSNRALIVLSTKLELNDELRVYLQTLVKERLVVIMETNQEGVRQYVERWNEAPAHKPILSLKVGSLEAPHGWAFVEARMRKVVGSEHLPVFQRYAVDKYMQDRTTHSAVSISELERVCIRLFNEATASSKGEITYEDFAAVWLRFGGAMR